MRGRRAGVSLSTVHRIWRGHALQPHRLQTFKCSPDPRLEEKIHDVVGLYLSPPTNAVVLSVDEKTQVQALNRTQPLLPLRPGLPARQTHDYQRNGVTSLYAALEVATGRVLGECAPRHTGTDFLRFLQRLARLPEPGLAPHPGQLVHPLHPGRPGLADRTPPRALSLHPHGCLLVEHGRGVVRHPHPQIHPAGFVRYCARPHPSHPALHCSLERVPDSIRLDQSPERDHHHGRAPNSFT
jgi:hypothetical protein